MRILIVEDDYASREVIAVLLKNYGKCEIAENGKKALELFRKSYETTPYEMVFLDIMMPDIDGHQVLDEIRKLEFEKNILPLERSKVIMTTALGNSMDIIKAFREQCEGYLIKPITMTKISDIMKTLNLI